MSFLTLLIAGQLTRSRGFGPLNIGFSNARKLAFSGRERGSNAAWSWWLTFGEDWLVGTGALKCSCVFPAGRKSDWENRSRDCAFSDCRLLLSSNCEGRENRSGCDDAVLGSGWVIRSFCLGKGTGRGSLSRSRGGADDIVWGALSIRRGSGGWEVGSLSCCWRGGGNFSGWSRGLNVCWEECVPCFWLELCSGTDRRLLDLARGWYNLWTGLGGGKESLLMSLGWRGSSSINTSLWGKGFADFLLTFIFAGRKGTAASAPPDASIPCPICRSSLGLRRPKPNKARKSYSALIWDLFHLPLFHSPFHLISLVTNLQSFPDSQHLLTWSRLGLWHYLHHPVEKNQLKSVSSKTIWHKFHL